jgi:hypothetical protein
VPAASLSTGTVHLLLRKSNVIFEVWGGLYLEYDTSANAAHRVRWDTRHEKSWANYLKARAKQAATPIPYGVCHATTPEHHFDGLALPERRL